ncbi:alpha/beta hydrolase [Mycobacterium intermedium]|uniref:Alpha/beta hydrolase n=1 Tax=Mycobacterium intermedium TaxID=28445 RepID=A0A1E3SAJ7_MYCIE|nr:alpha/beta hydrolase [Mycobacterium intermedium]MCV6966751.1 alpha/beta fold hydrolase [Mycobacterium intermedium]ODQ99185.1 hydrolase [Mycobacterium intermedium]OPE51367.1 alpha/beta hydrolase [Mycobacterium intermedium]ORB10649.1 alpha/beta hydrolase [Mycobacterium intermedium]
MDIFEEWQSGGTELSWTSTTAANEGKEVTVFTRRCGTEGAPALVLVHGFPTSSIDFFALARELESEFEIFTLDFPGYGLSDKPPEPYVYSLYDDAQLLVHMITSVWGLTEYRMLTHDRGSSIGMIALALLAEAEQPLPVDHIITNGNVYLPLSNLTAFQTALLDPKTGRRAAAEVTPELLAAGLGQTCFMPRRVLEDPELTALAKCFAHDDGIRVLPDTIQYLRERAADEKSWLEKLSKLPINVTLIWGLHDSVSPLRVANYVWQAYLREKPGRSRYWVVPTADHYVQNDAPAELAQIIRITAQGDGITLQLQTLGDRPDGAVLVDQLDTARAS